MLDRAAKTLTNSKHQTVVLSEESFAKVAKIYDGLDRFQRFQDSVVNRREFRDALAEAKRRHPKGQTRVKQSSKSAPAPFQATPGASAALLMTAESQTATRSTVPWTASGFDGVITTGGVSRNSENSDCYYFAIDLNSATNAVKADYERLQSVLADMVTSKWNTGIDLIQLGGQAIDIGQLVLSMNLPAYLASQAEGLMSDYVMASSILATDLGWRTVSAALFTAHNCMTWATSGPPDGGNGACWWQIIIEFSDDGGITWYTYYEGPVNIC